MFHSAERLIDHPVNRHLPSHLSRDLYYRLALGGPIRAALYSKNLVSARQACYKMPADETAGACDKYLHACSLVE
jgi:hypothetical protein